MLVTAATCAYLATMKARLPLSAQKALGRVDRVVLAVLFVFVFLYTVNVTCVIIPWLSYSVPGVLHLAALTATTSAALYCYACCMFFDPGSVPSGWQPHADEEAGGSGMQEVKRKDGAPRFCQKCQAFKPPRTHHCRVCGRCVLRMDHHCVFTATCIGQRNYKAFFLLVLYASAAVAHTVLLLAAHLLHWLRTARAATDPQTAANGAVVRAGLTARPVDLSASGLRVLWAHVALQVAAFAVALPTGVALLTLLSWHVRLVLRNKTTIEHMEGVTAAVTALGGVTPYGGGAGNGRRGRKARHPYDVGWRANLGQVFGESPLGWLMPPRRGASGGTRFPTAYDSSGGGGSGSPWSAR